MVEESTDPLKTITKRLEGSVGLNAKEHSITTDKEEFFGAVLDLIDLSTNEAMDSEPFQATMIGMKGDSTKNDYVLNILTFPPGEEGEYDVLFTFRKKAEPTPSGTWFLKAVYDQKFIVKHGQSAHTTESAEQEMDDALFNFTLEKIGELKKQTSSPPPNHTESS